MNSHVLTAIRSQPWAIMPGYLEAIEAIALRVLDDPAVLALKGDGQPVPPDCMRARSDCGRHRGFRAGCRARRPGIDHHGMATIDAGATPRPIRYVG